YSTAVWPMRCTSAASTRPASSAISALRASRSSEPTLTLISSWCSSARSTSAASASVRPLPPTCSIAFRSCAWPRRKRVWAAVRAIGMGVGQRKEGGGAGYHGHDHGHPKQVQPTLAEGALFRPLREEGAGGRDALARGLQAGGAGRARPVAEAGHGGRRPRG